MTLSTGTRLGPYEIMMPIGAGGMGEVYKARDTRLGRTVAVKVLPADVAADSNRRIRFEREAKAISQFSHPHICMLFDVGREGDTDFLVMEFLDGETLAQRLFRAAPGTPGSGLPAPASPTPSGRAAPEPLRQRLPLALEETIRIGSELAEALAAAHKAGIIHRDLKPGNIMLTRAGVKVLDFGLAKLRTTDGAADASAAATRTADPLTEAGTRLGTIPYMAPEQVEGREADARTDLFAFGAILYEMATGRRAFEGETAAGVAAAILDRDPPAVTALQPLTPPALGHLVTTCLAKDPEARWQAASDVARQLRWIADELRRVRTSTAASTDAMRGGPSASGSLGSSPTLAATPDLQGTPPGRGEGGPEATRGAPQGLLRMLVARSRLTMTGGISYMVFKTSDEIVKAVSDAAKHFPRDSDDVFYLNQGGGEITIICDADHEHLVASLQYQAFDYRRPVGVLRIRETQDDTVPRSVEVPGFYAYFIGLLAEHGINILELISGGRELALVLAEGDLTAAFTLLTDHIKECRLQAGI